MLAAHADAAHNAMPWRCTPAAAIRAWPADRPLVALVSADDPGAASSRWSILAPADGERVHLTAHNAADALESLRGAPYAPRAADAPPFASGWIGALHYELGRIFEPTARASRIADAAPAPDAPLGVLFRCDAAYVHDSFTQRWFAAGDPRAVAALPRLDCAGALTTVEPRFDAGPFRSACGRDAYEDRVRRVVEYVRAGDCFQANVAHRMRADFRGDARALYLALLDEARPAFGAIIEDAAPSGSRETILSISPELFLDADFATRRVVTRPIKGTDSATRGAAALLNSEKDAAELAMIVDLMRNDLGRVCEYGSVRVDQPRAIERHAQDVLHAVATVSGTMREGVNLASLLRATFPPGSVTGAPKVRAMQIIDELEHSPRGAYCGAVGFVSDSGISRWSVAIRTATIRGRAINAPRADLIDGELEYPVGAGVVADSTPEQEWRETLTKSGAAARALARGAPLPAPSTMTAVEINA